MGRFGKTAASRTTSLASTDSPSERLPMRDHLQEDDTGVVLSLLFQVFYGEGWCFQDWFCQCYQTVDNQRPNKSKDSVIISTWTEKSCRLGSQIIKKPYISPYQGHCYLQMEVEQHCKWPNFWKKE